MNIIRLILAVVAPEAELLLKVSKYLKLKPQQLVRVAQNAPAKLIDRINKLPGSLKVKFGSLMEDIVKDPKEVSRKLGELDAKGRKAFSETQQALTQIDETRRLSSSWLVKGHFRSVSLGSGELTIYTKSGGKYTYPGVPLRVWKAMRLAKGKNGSGAGSVFWALYLRGYNASYVGQLLNKLGKLTGIKVPASTIRKLRGK